MDISYTPYIWPLTFAAVASTVLAVYIWRRRRAAAARSSLALMAAAIGWYAAGYVLEILAPDLQSKVFWAKLEYVGLSSLPVFFFCFSLQYAGFGATLTRRRAALLAATPVVTTLLAASNDLHGLIWPHMSLETIGSVRLLALGHGPAFWAFTAISYALLVLGVGLLAGTTLQSSGPYRWQGFLLVAAITVPVLLNLGYGVGIAPMPYLNPTPIAFALWVTLVGLDIFRFRLLDLAPIARRAVFDHMRDGVLVLDSHSRIVDLNPAMAEATGVRPAEAIGRPAREVFARCSEFSTYLDEAAGTEVEIRVSGGGSARHCALSITAIPEQGADAAGRILVLRDMTALKQLEAQFHQAQRMEVIGQLAGGVAHDFNNLLTAITGYADLARDSLAPEDPARQDINRILRNAERGARLTRQLLAFARCQAMSPRTLDLNTLLQEVEGLLPRRISESIVLRVVRAPEPVLVWADAGQIEQVVINLVLNAIDAMPNGGALTVQAGNTTIREGNSHPPNLPPGEYATLSVTDTGTGMGAAIQEHLFEPFFTTKEAGKGTGLGLAAVFGIVRQHQGAIRVKSEPGRGSTFIIYLPRPASPSPDPAEPIFQGSMTTGTPSSAQS